MTTSVILFSFFLAFSPLSVGKPITCPPPVLNESAQQGSGKLCATLQLQTKLPCPSINLSISENVQLNPGKWHLESLSLKVEKDCGFTVLKQDKESQHFPEGFYANIPMNFIDTQSECVCICSKLHIRHKRAPTFYDFKMKHLVDNPADINDKKQWQKEWDSATKYRVEVKKNNNTPRKQSFMAKKDFNERFTRNFKVKASNNRILYRSENKMDIYDITNKNGKLDIGKRNDYVVVDLDNNDQPIHFEPVPDEFAEALEQMKPGETISIEKETDGSRVFKGWRGGVQQLEELEEPVAEGEEITMSVIGATSAVTQATMFTQIINFFTFLFV